MVDGRTCKNPKVVSIDQIYIYTYKSAITITGADIADVDFINETTIAVKDMSGDINLYSNCSYIIESHNCQIMKERYFPD